MNVATMGFAWREVTAGKPDFDLLSENRLRVGHPYGISAPFAATDQNWRIVVSQVQKMVKLDVHVPPLNTTLMGTVRGVADAFGIVATDPDLFVLTGHAFVVNIHPQICPSGPYCWNRAQFTRLLRNVGIDMSEIGYFDAHSSPDERSAVEGVLRGELDGGRPAGLVNMEFQLITGYDETGFDTSQPWPCMDFPPGRLSFGSWEELGDEIHLGFSTYERRPQTNREEAIRDALAFAIALVEQPKSISGESDYGLGSDAYPLWEKAIPESGAGHGCWWNGTVWAECRRMAAHWFAAWTSSGVTTAQSLANDYHAIADHLDKVADKETPLDDKQERIRECLRIELETPAKLRSFLEAL